MTKYRGRECGSVVIALLGLVLLGALAASLAILAHTESLIAANFAAAQEALYVADAGLQVGIDELAAVADWDGLVAGSATAGFVDGFAGGHRTLRDGTDLNLSDVTARLQGGPWRLFAFGPFSRLQVATATGESMAFLVVWIADDQAEDPDAMALRSEAFGLGGTRRAVEALVSRQNGLVSWHEAR